MISKKKLLASVKDMPERFSVDELIERLIFQQKVENGMKQSDEGDVFTTQEAKLKLKKWLK
jgi:predicted transcriptional regulator